MMLWVKALTDEHTQLNQLTHPPGKLVRWKVPTPDVNENELIYLLETEFSFEINLFWELVASLLAAVQRLKVFSGLCRWWKHWINNESSDACKALQIVQPFSADFLCAC